MLLEFMGKIVDTFWKRWSRDYFQTLIIRPKWHSGTREVRKGDVVMIKDANAIRGQWKMGIVASTSTGSDGRIRNVSVKYKIGSKFTYVDRGVQKLVVVLPVEEQ